jgi:hypothetical protein
MDSGDCGLNFGLRYGPVTGYSVTSVEPSGSLNYERIDL